MTDTPDTKGEALAKAAEEFDLILMRLRDGQWERAAGAAICGAKDARAALSQPPAVATPAADAEVRERGGVLEALETALHQYSESMSPLTSHELGERLASDVQEIVRHARARDEALAASPKAPAVAIPPEVNLVMDRILAPYDKGEDTLSRIKGVVAQYREAPFRSADWLAGEMMRILDTEAANDTAPAVAIGAGEVETIRSALLAYRSLPAGTVREFPHLEARARDPNDTAHSVLSARLPGLREEYEEAKAKVARIDAVIAALTPASASTGEAK